MTLSIILLNVFRRYLREEKRKKGVTYKKKKGERKKPERVYLKEKKRQLLLKMCNGYIERM